MKTFGGETKQGQPCVGIVLSLSDVLTILGGGIARIDHMAPDGSGPTILLGFDPQPTELVKDIFASAPEEGVETEISNDIYHHTWLD